MNKSETAKEMEGIHYSLRINRIHQEKLTYSI